MAVGRDCSANGNRIYSRVFGIPDWYAAHNRCFWNRFCGRTTGGGSACNTSGCDGSQNAETVWRKVSPACVTIDRRRKTGNGKYGDYWYFAGACRISGFLYCKSEKERCKMYRLSSCEKLFCKFGEAYILRLSYAGCGKIRSALCLFDKI